MRWPNITGPLALILLAAAVEVYASPFGFPFPGGSNSNQGPPPGSESWQYRPQEAGNARGVPPSRQQSSSGLPHQVPGQMPVQGRMPGYRQPGPGPGWPGQFQAPYGQPMAQQAGKSPRIELELSDHRPYVQENVLLKLRVISDHNLATATPELPTSNDVLLQKIEGPEASSRAGARGGQEIVNEFIYTLTPLRAGSFEVPPLRVSGTMYGNGFGYGQAGPGPFETTASETIRLQVRPAMASVRPWLPLHDLTLKATLDRGEQTERGEPMTLVLELNAVGAIGDQLPSLEPLLNSPDFRVYREQTLSEGGLSEDGRRIEGQRTEYFTLVPRAGGKLRLPEIRLAWWNVATGAKEYAGLPRPDGDTGAPPGLSPVTATDEDGGLSWLLLLPAGIALLLLGYWGGLWYHQGRTGMDARLLRERLGTVAMMVTAKAAELAEAMNPAPLLRRVRPRVVALLPPSSRFLGCVRAANREADPTVWAERFQESTRRHLQFRFDGRSPLPGISGKILALRPGADPEQLRRLMQQLDGALYGNQDIDFQRWKKQFYSQIGRRRGFVGSGGRQLRLIRVRLPELNPRPG